MEPHLKQHVVVAHHTNRHIYMFPWKSESVVRGNVLCQIPCTLDLGDTVLCAVLLWLVMGGACGEGPVEGTGMLQTCCGVLAQW